MCYRPIYSVTGNICETTFKGYHPGIYLSPNKILGVNMKTIIGVGIDCSKNKHVVCISDNMGNQCESVFTIHNKLKDVEYLAEKVLEVENKLGKADVVINMESTGIYHLPLYSVISKIFKTNIYQPKQVKDMSSKNIRKSKTDKRDARTLSRIHLEIPPPQTDYGDREMYDIREIIRQRFSYKDIRTNLKNKFRRNLSIVFPNFDTLFKNPYASVPWNLLKICPTPEDVLRLGVQDISKIMEKASRGQKLRVTPQDLIKLTEESIRCDIMDRGALFGLKALMEDIEYLDRRIKQIDNEIEIYWNKIKRTLYFPTFPGLDMVKAVALHTEYGGFRRFPHPDKAVAFAGLENMVYISGDSKNFNGRMTKAGSPIIRRVCWELLNTPVLNIPKITAHMDKLKSKGKQRNIRVHSASKKMIRTLWAMEHHEQVYVRET
ncbi:MAG: IS110 family transposase [ANME-2 cluster archaeon]|nr:MAG: IS110 family transposase [ANME-2 cluster archaeon]